MIRREVARCELCCQYKLRSEVEFVLYDFSKKPPVVEKTVEDWYSGIRVVCHVCIKGLSSLALQP